MVAPLNLTDAFVIGLKIQQVAQAVNISGICLTTEQGRKRNQPCLFYKTKILAHTVTCFSAPRFPVFVLAFIQISAQMLYVLLLAYGLFKWE